MNLDESFVHTQYNLLANICHEGNSTKGIYKIHVKNIASNEWFEIQDLSVTSIMPGLVILSEAYIQIYERIDEL